MLADLLVQAFAFGAEHQHGAAVERLLQVVPAGWTAGQAIDPGPGLLQLFQGPARFTTRTRGPGRRCRRWRA